MCEAFNYSAVLVMWQVECQRSSRQL